MEQFNTHGGYFAPRGYTKVEEGGSHEENPNGGVQLGVDQNGIPNMLEEGEPVYDDFVYSDNITADVEMLRKHNLPEKYQGKLYSEIADAYVDEASERPNDPISNKGLATMLGRLASAQEEQKAIKEQKELEKELSKLTPEEKVQLGQMLSMQEGQPQMMRRGGCIRRFDGGTPGEVVSEQKQPEKWSEDMIPDIKTPSLLELALGSDNPIVKANNQFQDWMQNSTAGKVIDFLTPDSAMDAFGSPVLRQAGRAAGPIGRSIARGAKNAWETVKGLPGKIAEVGGRKQMLEEAGVVFKEAKAAAAEAKNTANTIATELDAAKTALKAAPNDPALLQRVADLEAASAKADAAALKASAKATGAKAAAAGRAAGAVTVGPLYNRAALEAEVEGAKKALSVAEAEMKKHPKSEDLKKAYEVAKDNLAKVEGLWNKWWKHGEWQLKGGLYGAGIGAAAAKGNSSKKNNWVESQFATGGLVRLFGGGTPGRVYKEDGTEYSIGDISPELGVFEGYDDNGVAMWSPAELTPATITALNPKIWNRPVVEADVEEYIPSVSLPGKSIATVDSKVEDDAVTGKNKKAKGYPTGLRYAGALTSGLLGLYNVFQEPDKYSVPTYSPVLPTGEMHLVDPTYSPEDENLVLNQLLAQSAGTARALSNAGLGPSTGANLLALDYNTGRNIGAARAQVRANNLQQRNAVINAINNNRTALANFRYGLSRDRAQILNDAQLRNQQTSLTLQRLNNAAEAEKYAAISNQIDQMGKALSDMGTENFRMNQVSGMFDYGYDTVKLPDGTIAYRPKKKGMGGTLLKKYK